MDFVDGHWKWLWSNCGNSSAAIFPYRFNLKVGDFNGDGKDELFGKQISSLALFEYSGMDFNQTRGASNTHSLTQHTKYYAGDFNGDGSDELLSCNLPDSWTTIFDWDQSSGDFSWGYWSDYGNVSNSLRPYRNNLLVGDLDGSGRKSLLGFNAWVTHFKYYNNAWQWGLEQLRTKLY